MSVTTELIGLGPSPYPGLAWQANEDGGPPYHYFEDREDHGVLYRVQNALFDGTQWHVQDTSKGAYAFALNGVDGSIIYLAPNRSGSTFDSWAVTGKHGVYDVRDFGASGTGLTDDSVYIQAAATACNNAGGGTVYVPPGKYLMTNFVKLGSETILQGSPAGSSADDPTARSVLVADSSINGGGMLSGNIVVANIGYDNPQPGMTLEDNITIRDLNFDGNAAGNLRSYGNATLFFLGVKNVRIENCAVFNCANHAISVVSTASPANPTQGNVWIRNNIIDVMPKRDMVPPSPTYALTSGNIAIRCEALDAVFIDSNVIGFNGRTAAPAWIPTWSNDAIDVPGCNYATITNNQIQWATDGIGLNNSVNAIVSGNIISNCIGEGISSFAPSVSGVSYLTIVGNIVSAVPSDKIVLQLGTMIFAIRSTSNNGPTSQYVTITGNICYGPFTDGAIDGNSANTTISDNQIDCQGTIGATHYPGLGISIKQNSCTVTGNTIRNQYGSTNAAAILIFTSMAGTGLLGIVVQGNNIDGSNTTPIQFQSNLNPQTGLISENFGIVTYATIA